MGETWELPEGWAWAQIEDVAKVDSDLVTLRTRTPPHRPEPYRVVDRKTS